jgi:hypothetical protein
VGVADDAGLGDDDRSCALGLQEQHELEGHGVQARGVLFGARRQHVEVAEVEALDLRHQGRLGAVLGAVVAGRGEPGPDEEQRRSGGEQRGRDGGIRGSTGRRGH